MAKAQFHKNQRVYVKPVGTWALIERVIPHWAKGLDEPIRVFYDVGLGREFSADELQAEQVFDDGRKDERNHWRVIRARNKWQPTADCARHPVPGTYPIVITGETDWGGWRVPGAEYDLDPEKVEKQARLIANAPRLASLANELIEWARRSGEEMPSDLAQLAHDAQDVLANLDGES
ncbi:MAG TPA: hypothetical protein VL286_03500 [Rhizomicrobium sp.]|jgi:hypothetical protein|nr:hypothetical protein [Rhizomicrobium sp.]